MDEKKVSVYIFSRLNECVLLVEKAEDDAFHLPPIGSNLAVKSVSQKNLSKKLQVRILAHNGRNIDILLN